MDLFAGFRRVFTGDRQRERPPGDSVTLGDARRAFGSWRGVAQAMGVSERTLRRIRNEGRVSGSSRRRLDELGRQGAVRRAAVRPGTARRAARMASAGARAVVRGDQGPAGYRRGDYRRNRAIEAELSPEQYDEIRNAYLDGDEERAAQLFGDALQDSYGGGSIPGDGWSFGELQSITFEEFGSE